MTKKVAKKKKTNKFNNFDILIKEMVAESGSVEISVMLNGFSLSFPDTSTPPYFVETLQELFDIIEDSLNPMNAFIEEV